MRIRTETTADQAAIYHITKAAFAVHTFSPHTEQLIIDALRAADALTISLVAERNGEVVGHVAFSPVTISDTDGNVPDWHGLGPISVAPEYQGQGIGRALMEEGMRRLAEIGAEGCVLVGDPAFYRRFGFDNRPELTFAGVPPEYLLARQLRPGKPPHGEVRFHPAFETTA